MGILERIQEQLARIEEQQKQIITMLQQRGDLEESCTEDEAALALKVSKSKVVKMIAKGEISSTKVGRCRRIPREEVARIVREGTA